MTKPTLLIVDDDEAICSTLQRALRSDYYVTTINNPNEVWQNLTPPPDAILLDLRLDESEIDNQDGLKLLDAIHRQQPSIPLVMITGYSDVEIAVEAMRLGAVDFIQKSSLKPSELKIRLKRAIEQGQLTKRVAQLEQELALVEPRQIIGESAVMQEVKRIVRAVAEDGDVTVLIRGETGTGKELIARAIHSNGRRKNEPFVAVMLNALPQSTLEAELFGHEKGAFTDAREKRIGYLEQAHGGVLFLDEIGEIDLQTQIKLLRFIEEREFQRIGSTKNIKVDVQILAATNANLESLVSDKRFREDLYYRLKVHEILLPPLRARAGDISLIVEHLIKLFHQRGKKISDVSADSMKALCNYSWMGNIRELRNVIESAILKAEINEHQNIELKDLPNEILTQENLSSTVFESTLEPLPALNGDFISVHEALARTELSCVAQAINAVGGKKTEAWKLLGYNDRFIFSRRVRRIFEQFPQLRAEFSEVNRLFS